MACRNTSRALLSPLLTLSRLTVSRTAKASAFRSVVVQPLAGWAARGMSTESKVGTSTTNSGENFDPRTFIDTGRFADKEMSEEEVKMLRRALLYRSRQTGWLETDIIMGRWAEKNINSLTLKELEEYCQIVKGEILPIYRWIVKQDPVPAELEGNSVVKKLQDYALLEKKK
mmetsp:Transcript_63517/g.151442  ORF Transcript_63517/g.151442 Transcript_63517/m.151442 type:complete len:172 (-) Transcript_63517:53-568(-)